MKFACDRCRKRFSTVDEPVAGRVYRVPCRCGNTIVIEADGAIAPPPLPSSPRRTAGAVRRSPPPLPALATPILAPAGPAPALAAAADADVSALVDDAFARATRPVLDLRAVIAGPSDEVTPTVLAPLVAPRDRNAADVSSAYAGASAADPFTRALRRTRTQAFALGGAAGGAVGAFFAAVLAALVLRPAGDAVARPAGSGAEVAVAEVPPRQVPDRPVARRKPPPARASVAAATTPRALTADAPPAPASAAAERRTATAARATPISEAAVPALAAPELLGPAAAESATAEQGGPSVEGEDAAATPPERSAGGVARVAGAAEPVDGATAQVPASGASVEPAAPEAPATTEAAIAEAPPTELGAAAEGSRPQRQEP